MIDFGVAKALDPGSTGSSAVVGTPSYMAPEQVGAAQVGPPADVWAWAATITFAATGRPPFGSDTIPAVMGRILHAEPDLGNTPEPLRELVAASLAKDPAARPTAPDLLMRLIGHAGAIPDIMAEGRTLAATRADAPRAGAYGPYGAPQAPPAGPPQVTAAVAQRPHSPSRSRAWILPIAAAAVALLVGVGLGAWALGDRGGDPGASRAGASPAGGGAQASPGASESAKPARWLVINPTGTVTLPPGRYSVEITLTAQGGAVEWSALEIAAPGDEQVLTLNYVEGRVVPGRPQKVMVTVRVPARREPGKGTVVFSAANSSQSDQSVDIEWS